MDDLLKSMNNSLEVTASPNSIYKPHPRFDQYKQKSLKSSDQNTRREKRLADQKSRRYNYQSHVRCLALDEWDEDVENEPNKDVEMDVDSAKKPPKRYRDQLMLSEWMVDTPGDFESEWTMLVCPLGRRNLVVASGSKTFAYSKSGYCVKTFPSALPGGSYENNSGYTVLDCIFNEFEKTFYVLDVMCWNNCPVYDSETEFRFFWVAGKLAENPELSENNKSNTFKFVHLTNHKCDKDSIVSALNHANASAVDGLLFYHKRTHYTFGTTPLVTWLKVHMLADVLNIQPPPHFTE